MHDLSLWHLLQTSDSAFPVGGFAHSYGLEGMVQAGLVDTPNELETFLVRTWFPLLARVDFPLVRGSARVAMDDGSLFRLDELAWACRATAEARKAQERMGRQRLSLTAGLSRHPRLLMLAEAAEQRRWMANWPCVWGAETACLGIDLNPSLTAYGYQSVNGILAASAKLIRIGPTDIQGIMYRTRDAMMAAIEASAPVTENDIGCFTPALDIAGSRHETAYTRLFIS